MKARFIFSAAAILIAMMFAMNGCGNSNNVTIVSIESNESNDSDDDGNDGEVGETPAQFEKGVALFGHDVETGTHFTMHLKPKMGAELAKTPYGGHHYESMTPIWIDGRQYVMGISSKKGDNGYRWFIQLIFPSGDFGPLTDLGYFSHHYKTLITLTRPSGDVFIYGQRDYADNTSFTRKVLPGGKLADKNADSKNRAYYYDATTALPNNYHTCLYAQDSDDGNHWIIDCIYSDGTFFHDSRDHDAGTWGHGYQVALSYREGDQSHLFGHRHRYDADTHTYGPWFIRNITTNSYMGSNTDSGSEDNGDEWHNYYKTMTTFFSPEAKYQYVIGHNTDKHWFIKHVSSYGHMDATLQSGGPWGHYYEHLFPIDLDTSYLSVDNWMERMFDEIEGFGDRKLSQIALPGSHDSGMSPANIHECCLGAGACNTQTQFKDIGGQLSLGARYFDIRPMIDFHATGSGAWTTGHSAKVEGVAVGCRGESKESIVDNLNNFFADGKHAKELVILKVSHCATPPGDGYVSCSDDKKSTLAHDLASRLGNHVVKGDLNLKEATLQEILAKGNIILAVDGFGDKANGVFEWGVGKDYFLYDSYSNTEEFSVMVNGGTNNDGDYVPGQIQKLLNSNFHTDQFDGFLLSWTLTLSTWDAISCPLSSPSNIMEMAVKAQPRIYEYMYKHVENGDITKTLFPNILYVDSFNRTTTNAAVYLNRKYDSLKD